MFERLNLKFKLIGMFVALLVVTGCLLTGVTYYNAAQTAQELTEHTLNMKISGDIQSARVYAQQYFGQLMFEDGRLVDSDGQPVEGRHEMVDRIAEDLDVVATIFQRDGRDFQRVSTNIRTDSGDRAVGTHLGTSSAAYEPVSRRETFVGEAQILGQPYLTGYDPILDEHNEVVGILFLGIPRQDINEMTAASLGLMLRNALLAFAVVLGAAILLSVSFAFKLSNKIQRIVSQLAGSAGEIDSASHQVAAASQSLAEGATEQAAGLEETSSSLEEMSSMTRQNADNSQQASSLATEARQAASEGTESMQKMNQAIEDIQKSSDETAKIIKVIDEIAFQTNLLALNAAVEAARAGEAGKGFAVVAEEVRNLAMRSAEAAKNTASMIEESVKNSKNGVDIAGEVDKMLNRIVESIGKTTDLVGEIAAASQEQAQGIDQINTAVTQMDQVTQQNAANAEESASASEELSSQAANTSQIVKELVALVDGVKAGSARANTVRTGQGTPIKRQNLSPADRTFHQIAEKQPKHKQKVAAGKAIPLDDDDFKDFDG